MFMFGLRPDCKTKAWIGCRAVYSKKEFYVPWDRWSHEYEGDQTELIEFTNKAINSIEKMVIEGKNNGTLHSKDERFHCIFDTRESGGYVYCGFFEKEEKD